MTHTLFWLLFSFGFVLPLKIKFSLIKYILTKFLLPLLLPVSPYFPTLWSLLPSENSAPPKDNNQIKTSKTRQDKIKMVTLWKAEEGRSL